MEKSMNDDILKKVDELVNYLKKRPEYLKYQELVKQVKDNEEIMNIINKVKKMQKEAVKKEYNGESVTEINKEIDSCLKELEKYPIYAEMNYLKEDLDNLFGSIKNILDSYMDKQIN